MATILKKKGKRGTTFEVQIRVRNKKVFKSFKDRNSAKLFCRDMEALIYRGGNVLDGKISTKQIIKRYIAEIVPTHKRKVDTTRRLNHFIKHNPYLADTPLKKLNVQDWLEWKNKRLGDGVFAFNTDRRLLHSMFNTARDIFEVPLVHNPLAKIKTEYVPKGKWRPIKRIEYRRIMEYGLGDHHTIGQIAFNEHISKTGMNLIEHEFPFYVGNLLLRQTGMRPAEMLTATHNDLEADRRILYLQKTKTNKNRTVPLRPIIVKHLQKLKSMYGSNKLIPLTFDQFNERFAKMISVLKIKDFTPYTYRRNFASSWVEFDKGSIAKLCDLGGWSDWKTAQIYARGNGFRGDLDF